MAEVWSHSHGSVVGTLLVNLSKGAGRNFVLFQPLEASKLYVEVFG